MMDLRTCGPRAMVVALLLFSPLDAWAVGGGCSSDVDCDDGVDCTLDLCQIGGECVNVPDDAACDDFNHCTFDICEPASGLCQHFPAPSGSVCIDSSGNLSSCDGVGNCIPGSTSTCGDGTVNQASETCDGSDLGSTSCTTCRSGGTAPCTCCGDAVCDSVEDQCTCPQDCGSPPTTEIGLCTDGIDNDCSGKADCADPICNSDPACAEICHNGVDDDGDGYVDCCDSDCNGNLSCQERCGAPGDEDCDGLENCDDPDCANFPPCQ